MRAQRASALHIAGTASSPVPLPPQILPVVPTKQVDAGARRGTSRSKKLQKGKVQQTNKAAQRKRSTVVQKRANKAASNSKRASITKNMKKLGAPAGTNAVAELIPCEKPVVESNAETAETTLTAGYEPISLVPPVPAIREEEPIDCNSTSFELVSDQSDTDVLTAATELAVTPDEPALQEPISAVVAEKPTFGQAINLQLRSLFQVFTRAWLWTQQKLKSHQVRKRLRVCETVSLGEKRFVAVIQVDGEQFLVGGSSSSVSTLAHLEPRPEFSAVFRNRCEQDLSQA